MERATQSIADEFTVQRSRLMRRSSWGWSLFVLVMGGVLYGCIVIVTGGFAHGDADSTLYSSVMFSHGHWACAYRSIPTSQPLAGPVYSFVSGVVQWITRAGFSTGYLSASQVGINCQHAYASYVSFSRVANQEAYDSALRTAMVAWFVLALSAIAIGRTTEWRATRITWLIPLTFALTPPVIFCLQEFYHPQDVWALGMAFVAVAFGLRGRSIVAGALWALAVMSQPFTLLGVAVMLVISPWNDRRRLLIGGIIGASLTSTVFYAISGPRALSSAFFGTGDTTIHAGTWMSELHVSSIVGLAISRVAPLIGTGLVAWWVRSRRTDVASDPIILLGLLATAWSLRLVFEENLWGYYCMATGATLVLRDILARHTSRGTIYWLVLVLIAFGDVKGYPRPWGAWHYWVWQLLLAPSGFVVALFSLRASMKRLPSSGESSLTAI